MDLQTTRINPLCIIICIMWMLKQCVMFFYDNAMIHLETFTCIVCVIWCKFPFELYMWKCKWKINLKICTALVQGLVYFHTLTLKQRILLLRGFVVHDQVDSLACLFLNNVFTAITIFCLFNTKTKSKLRRGLCNNSPYIRYILYIHWMSWPRAACLHIPTW